jgi:hypothetical protein
VAWDSTGVIRIGIPQECGYPSKLFWVDPLTINYDRLSIDDSPSGECLTKSQ